MTLHVGFARRLSVELGVVVNEGKKLCLPLGRSCHSFLVDSVIGMALMDLNASLGLQ
jgi:hypothetical protein